MRRLSAWLLAAAVVGVLGGAAALGIALQAPEPLTGDVEADAACATAASRFLDEDGRPNKSNFLVMTPEERRALVSEVTAHSDLSSIPEIKEAGEVMAAATNLGGGFPGLIGSIEATVELAKACHMNGWNAKAAGMVSE